MSDQPLVRYNKETGQMEEAVFQPVTADSYQTNIDAAQATVEAAVAARTEAERVASETEAAAAAAAEVLESAIKTEEAAQTELSFQTARKTAFDEAVRVRDEAEPEDESGYAEASEDDADATTDGDDTDGELSESPEYQVPVNVL